MPLISDQDKTVPVTVQQRAAIPPRRAFEIITPIDLSLVFKGWGPFPAVRGVNNQSGEWDHVGASRTPILSDGSTATERLTEYTAGHSFAMRRPGRSGRWRPRGGRAPRARRSCRRRRCL
jgi:hypothetical protein